MAKTATMDAPRANYGVLELILVLIAAALVAVTIWYVRDATTNANTNYSITETSQKPAPKKAPANPQ